MSIIVLVGCNSQSIKQSNLDYSGPFFGIQPTTTPQLLAPELLASAAQEYNGTFSPDGKQFYYTTDIPSGAFITFTELLPDNTWSKPKIASFSGRYSDYDPIFSPDGNRIYFSSSRPFADNTNSKNWYVVKENDKWSNPKRIVLTGEEVREYYCSGTMGGTLYFNIWSTGNIFKAVPEIEGYRIEELPEPFMGDYDQGDPFISPEEDYLIFRGYRNDGYGNGDLYISFNINNNWTEPENLGEPINSSANEMCPYVTTDEKIFIFSSSRISQQLKTNPLDDISKVRDHNMQNGNENIYYMSTQFIQELKQKHMN